MIYVVPQAPLTSGLYEVSGGSTDSTRFFVNRKAIFENFFQGPNCVDEILEGGLLGLEQMISGGGKYIRCGEENAKIRAEEERKRKAPKIAATLDTAEEEVKPSESRDEWSLTQDGVVSYRGKTMSKAFDPPVARLYFSKGSQSGAYRYVVLVDLDKGGVEGYIVRNSSKSIVARLREDVNTNIMWSPNEKHAVVIDGGEIQTGIYLINLTTGVVSRREISSWKDPFCDVPSLLSQLAFWVEDTAFRISVEVSPNETDSKCKGANAKKITTVDIDLN